MHFSNGAHLAFLRSCNTVGFLQSYVCIFTGRQVHFCGMNFYVHTCLTHY